MKVVYAERARRDVADIYDAIAIKNPRAAQRVEDRIRRTCEALVEFPFAPVATDVPNVRRVPLVRYPYTIFYRINLGEQRIEILRVVHGARVKALGRVPDAC